MVDPAGVVAVDADERVSVALGESLKECGERCDDRVLVCHQRVRRSLLLVPLISATMERPKTSVTTRDDCYEGASAHLRQCSRRLPTVWRWGESNPRLPSS